MNKEIRFSAKDTGVSDFMSRLRSESRRLHEDLIKDAKASTTSQKDALKYIEEQIRAIERRNKVDRDAEKFSLKDRYQKAMSENTNPMNQERIKNQFAEGMKQVNRDSEADKMQVELLKDLLETTRQNAASELKAEGREGVENRMHRERMSQQEREDQRKLNESQDRPGALSAGVKGIMYARGLSKMMEQGESGGRSALDTVSGGLMMSGNPYAMAAGGILDFLTGAFTLVQKQQKMVFESGALIGKNPEGLMQGGFGYGGGDQDRIERIGMDREEYLQRFNSSVRSYGKGISESHAMRDIYAEKTFGLDQGLISEIQRLTRTMTNHTEVQSITNRVYQSMYQTGALGADNKSAARMQDLVGMAVSMQTDRFMRTGLQTGFDERLRMMRGLEMMGGSYKDDRYKQATIQQLESGVSTMPNKMVHAIKLKKAKEMFPNQNPFELFATIQSGDPRLIAPLMDDLMAGTDNETLAMQRMYDLFGGQVSAQNVVQLTKNMRKGQKITRGLPSKEDFGVAANQDAIRRFAQSGTPELNAEMLMLWNEAISASTTLMSKFQNALAGLINML